MDLLMPIRLHHIDAAGSRVVLQRRLDEVASYRAKLETGVSNPQSRYSTLALEYESIAYLKYALGEPIEEVRDGLRNSIYAYSHVCELRGTEPAFPVYVADAAQPSELANLTPINRGVDYSLTNSRRCFLAVCQAMAAQDISKASELAAEILDPPTASYVGKGSFCTPNQQAVAYAMREFFAGRMEGVHRELDKVQADRRETSTVQEAAMLRAIAEGGTDAFFTALSHLLEWHAREAIRKVHAYNASMYMCTSGVGLCALAVERRLCCPRELRELSSYLPTELFESRGRID